MTSILGVFSSDARVPSYSDGTLGKCPYSLPFEYNATLEALKQGSLAGDHFVCCTISHLIHQIMLRGCRRSSEGYGGC